MSRPLSVLLVVVLVGAGCAGGSSGTQTTDTGPPPPVGLGPGTTAGTTTSVVTTQPAAPLQGLDLDTVARRLIDPLFVTAPPGDARLFVLEKRGFIRIISDGVLVEQPFLDIEEDVQSDGLEQGLLGLAFHPDYSTNGRFFIYYTNRDGDSRLVEYAAPPEADQADSGSRRLILGADQPAINHNAGMLQFGPDGYLYVSFGDGGGAGDQYGNGQDSNTWLATILRIDVDAATPYAIPPDNPFVAGGGAPEIWAYGLRNPWRFSIDASEGLMYIADVGQDEWEEISVVPLSNAGYNFGWPIVEGDECFRAPQCDTEGLVRPVLAFGHGEGCSVIGGFAYRGPAIPELAGHYFYGDWCGRWVRSFRYQDGRLTDEADWTTEFGEVGQIMSFGTDAAGELYVTTMEGFVFKIVPVR